MWKPKNYSLGSALSAGISTSDTNVPNVDLPAVGETLQIIAHGWGSFEILREGSNIPDGSDIIEVEVKAIKKSKVVIE